MQIRSAVISDAEGMSRVLAEIIAATGRKRPFDEAFVLSQYISNPSNVLCSVAVDDAGKVLGFQSLIESVAGNHHRVPEGRGIIGTHVGPLAHRQRVGTALFLRSRKAARLAGLATIEARIASDNRLGLAYYDALGFSTYEETIDVVRKIFVVETDI